MSYKYKIPDYIKVLIKDNPKIISGRKNFKNKKFVCASDGFFPFIDAIKLLKKNKCNDIAQPSGSINDKNIIEYANTNKLSLYFIKNRLFKH